MVRHSIQRRKMRNELFALLRETERRQILAFDMKVKQELPANRNLISMEVPTR